MLRSDFISIHGEHAWRTIVKPILKAEDPPAENEVYDLVHHQIIEPLINRLNKKHGNKIHCLSLVRAKHALADELTDLDWQNLLDDALEQFLQHTLTKA